MKMSSLRWTALAFTLSSVACQSGAEKNETSGAGGAAPSGGGSSSGCSVTAPSAFACPKKLSIRNGDPKADCDAPSSMGGTSGTSTNEVVRSNAGILVNNYTDSCGSICAYLDSSDATKRVLIQPCETEEPTLCLCSRSFEILLEDASTAVEVYRRLELGSSVSATLLASLPADG